MAAEASASMSYLRKFVTEYFRNGTTAPNTIPGAEQPTNGKPKQKPDAVGPSSNPRLDKKEFEVLEDRRRDLKKARAAWVAVKTKAEEDLEKVKEGARREYMADANQFPRIVQGCKSIDDILDNLDNELRDTLDQYASTPVKNQSKLVGIAAGANEILGRYLDFVGDNPLMKAIDMKEFADVTIHAPVLKALKDLKKALA
jgi:hypothetical protein